MFSGCWVGKTKCVFRTLGREGQMGFQDVGQGRSNGFSGCWVGKTKCVFRMLGREGQMGFQDVG